MNGNENQIELFEFTEEEEKSIEETIFELTEIMCVMVAEGVSSKDSYDGLTSAIDIIGHIVGEERKKSLNFAMISSREEDGNIKIDGLVSKKSKLFLQNLLTNQLQTLEVNIPRAVEHAKKHGNLIEGAANIYALPQQNEVIAIEN